MLTMSVQTAIGEVIEAALAPVPVLNIEIAEGQDYEANEVIFVTVRLPAGTGLLPPSKYAKAIGDVSRTLLKANDERMPLLRTKRAGEPDTVEAEPIAVP